MTESSADVVIVGGGIAGVVVERDAIGSHASGFAYGGLSPLSGFGIPGPRLPACVQSHPTGSSCSAMCPGSMTPTWQPAAPARAFSMAPPWGGRSPISSSVGTRGSRSTPSRPAASPALAKRQSAREARRD